MTKLSNIAAARAHKNNDSTLWTPADALEEVLNDVREGKEKPTSVLILLLEVNEDGSWDLGHCIANLTRPNHLALLELAKDRLLEDWRKK